MPRSNWLPAFGASVEFNPLYASKLRINATWGPRDCGKPGLPGMNPWPHLYLSTGRLTLTFDVAHPLLAINRRLEFRRGYAHR
jgi:hypothetical protein